MSFGVLELLVIAGVGWLAVRLVRGLRGERAPRLDQTAAPQIRSRTEEVDARLPNARPPLPPGVTPPPLSPRAGHDQKMAELRRRYVADEITVEQYEAELDKLLRSE